MIDALRSHYAVPMTGLLRNGDPVWVRWYPTAPEAKPLGLWTAFGSSVWEIMRDATLDGRGEPFEGHLWRSSKFTPPPGVESHGEEEWWMEGVPDSAINAEPMTELCHTPVADSRGGILLGGSSEINQEEIDVSLYVQKSTVSTLTGSVADLDMGDGTAYRLASSGPITIDGMNPVANGRIVIIDNVGDYLIRFRHGNAGATAAHRFLAIDQDSIRVYPGYAGQFQYDGTSERWRELATVPFVREKGDLLTFGTDAPARLPVSPTEGHVLRAKPSAPVGMDWGPPSAPNVGDWWHWQPGAIAGVPAQRWAVAGLGVGDIAANEAMSPDCLLALPLPRPRGGTIDKIGIKIHAVSSDPGAVISLGLYSNLADGIAFPAARLAQAVDIDASVAGAVEITLDPAITLSPGALVWAVFLGSGFADVGVIASATVPNGLYPILGSGGPANEGIGIGWTVGWDSSGMGPGEWSYSDGLPATFPISVSGIGVRVWGTGNPPAPAIHFHFSA